MANLPDPIEQAYQQIRINNTITFAEFKYRCNDPGGPDLIGLDLGSINPANLDLAIDSFSYRKIKRPVFCGSAFKNATFSSGGLTKVDFKNTNLTANDLAEAIVNGARFKGSVPDEIAYPKTRYAKPKKTSLTVPKLDLHGETPLDTKCNWVAQFVKNAQSRGYSHVEIITGRGIHNPSGTRGIQWALFKRILTSKSYRPYVDSIQSLNKDGAWRVNLKSSAIKTKKNRKLDNPVSLKKGNKSDLKLKRKVKSKSVFLERNKLRLEKYKLGFLVQKRAKRQVPKNERKPKIKKGLKPSATLPTAAKTRKPFNILQTSSAKKKKPETKEKGIGAINGTKTQHPPVSF